MLLPNFHFDEVVPDLQIKCNTAPRVFIPQRNLNIMCIIDVAWDVVKVFTYGDYTSRMK